MSPSRVISPLLLKRFQLIARQLADQLLDVFHTLAQSFTENREVGLREPFDEIGFIRSVFDSLDVEFRRGCNPLIDAIH